MGTGTWIIALYIPRLFAAELFPFSSLGIPDGLPNRISLLHKLLVSFCLLLLPPTFVIPLGSHSNKFRKSWARERGSQYCQPGPYAQIQNYI